MAGKPGTSENIVEMAAEIEDPAWWATMQLVKKMDTPPKTVGDAHRIIAAIFRDAMDMELDRLRKQERKAVK